LHLNPVTKDKIIPPPPVDWEFAFSSLSMRLKGYTTVTWLPPHFSMSHGTGYGRVLLWNCL